MVEFTGSSGAQIVINTASWPDAKKLKMAVEQEAAAGKINLTDLQGGSASDIVIGTVLRVDGSPAFDAALWPCLARCLRAGQKITEQTFDDAEARQDYYDIVIACLKANFGPLVESLASKLPLLQPKPSEDTPL